MTETLYQAGEVPADLKSVLQDRYLAYALSTIMHRALPDVRDGLKPVHRRIMYAMQMLRLYPDQSYAKCARIVGDVMGKYHPHGDQAIYDSLVRLAQTFSMRYPLVDGQGNFGNIDGDNAAAMRYTEARLMEVASLLLEGLNEDAVDFVSTYNEEGLEPEVLPSAFPNLLANGSSGIAVGMATSIPPHNVAELCDAALHLIRNPKASVEDLLEFVLGPDFPTGGVLVNSKEKILEAYQTGRGSFRVRARWHKEIGKHGTWSLVVTELPYQVQKSRLVEQVAELLLAKKIPALSSIRDESAEDIRIVFLPKNRQIDAELLMELLFKFTDLETRFSLNMNVLSHGKRPNVVSLREALEQWLEHRKKVLLRRSGYKLDKIKVRLEILQGYLIAHLNIDEVIQIIKDHDEPKPVLMKRFHLSDNQAEAILNIRLRSLRKLEALKIQQELNDLARERQAIEQLLLSEKKQWEIISLEVASVRGKWVKNSELGQRRTIPGTVSDLCIENLEKVMIEKESVTVILSKKGWIRFVKKHVTDFSDLTFRENDKLQFALNAYTTDKILLFSTDGKFYTLNVNSLPSGRGHGEPVRIMIDMEKEQEIIFAFVHKPGRKRLLITRLGKGFVIAESDILANTRKGKQVLKISSPDQALLCVLVDGDHVAIVGNNRRMLVFPLSEIPKMIRGKGVQLQKYKKGYTVSDVKIFNWEEGLSWTDMGGRNFTRSKDELLHLLKKRASVGGTILKGFPASGKFHDTRLEK